MITNFDNYIKEGFKYFYPYQRIMVLINSLDDYHSVYEYIEKTFHISIIRERDDQTLSRYNLTHILICVDTIYDAIGDNNFTISEYNILCFYTLRGMSVNSILDEIKQERMVSYINFDDILRIDEIKSIETLIKYGIKYLSYNILYNKNKKENIYESLLSKISGPTFDEVFNDRESFRIKINSKEEFENYLDYFNKKGILGEFITIGTAMRNYIISDEIKYYKRWKEFSLSIEPLSFAKSYTDSFGDYNIFLAINTIAEIHEGDVVPLILDDTTKLEYYVNKLISKASDINDDVNESLLSKIEGPSEEDVLKTLDSLTPNNMFARSCKRGLLVGVKKAIELGADITAYEEYSETTDIIRQPFEERIITYEDDMSGLEYLIQNNDIEIFKYIFDKCDVKKYIELEELLELCSVYANIDCAKILIENGVDINDDDRNVLTIAVNCDKYNSHYEYIEFLLENGADPNIHNGYVIKLAKKRDNKEIIELLNRFK